MFTNSVLQSFMPSKCFIIKTCIYKYDLYIHSKRNQLCCIWVLRNIQSNYFSKWVLWKSEKEKNGNISLGEYCMLQASLSCSIRGPEKTQRNTTKTNLFTGFFLFIPLRNSSHINTELELISEISFSWVGLKK